MMPVALSAVARGSFGRTKLAKYEIHSVIGSGAMGVVYEGWDPLIARRVAIKTVHLADTLDEQGAEGLARFRREAQAAGRLSHPNIVGIYDYGEDGENAYIVMEFVEGDSLKTLLDRKNRLSIAATMRIAEELLAGLQFSHDHGVIHRDVKPANVMVTTDGRVKIADFGIARIESSNLTQSGAMVGTPAYMSPEQFTGQIVDARTDIYSAGVLLYQMLSGRRPFDGTASVIMQKVMNTKAPHLSELSPGTPPRFDPVIARAMARHPVDRFASAAEFAHALRKAWEAVTAESKISTPRGGEDADVTVLAVPAEAVCGIRPELLSKARRGPAPARRSGRSIVGMLGGASATILIVAGVGIRIALQPLSPERVSPIAPPLPGKFIVFFPAWSASLDDRALAKVIAAAQWAKQHPAQQVTVAGFAAPDGSQAANVGLSATRAQLVVDQLARDGVAPLRMHLIAHGPTGVTDSLSEGRRVEIDIADP
jgi:serine/threonine-protein kinase